MTLVHFQLYDLKLHCKEKLWIFPININCTNWKIIAFELLGTSVLHFRAVGGI